MNTNTKQKQKQKMRRAQEADDVCSGTVEQEVINDTNQVCRNCGVLGHHVLRCKAETMSYGILCLQYMGLSLHDIVEASRRGITVTNVHYHPMYTRWMNEIENNLKILMIRRKDSISYIEFIRGKYDLKDKGYLMILFNAMSNKEKQTILMHLDDFQTLWVDVWSLDRRKKRSKQMDKDYFFALLRFNTLQNSYDIFKLIEESGGEWTEPEWGFPKGRRNKDETDLDCAIREFQEETGFNTAEYRLLCLKPVYETYVSSNNREYKHVYYVAESGRQMVGVDENYLAQVIEVAEVKWVSYKEATKLIRSYQDATLKSLQYLFNHLKNIIIAHHFYPNSNMNTNMNTNMNMNTNTNTINY